MDGVHDMGGMHGFGLVLPGDGEPAFDALWEGGIFGIAQALEHLEPATCMGASYLERYLEITERSLLAKGPLTTEELYAHGRGVPTNRRQASPLPNRRFDT